MILTENESLRVVLWRRKTQIAQQI